MNEFKSTVCAMSGTEQARLIREKKLSPVELVTEIIGHVHRFNPILNAYCVLDEEQAMESAKAAERDVMSGVPLGPLHGVPVAVKDLICTKGIRTTFGSKLYEDFIPDEDDIVVERMKQAGAIILGKTNASEFGYNAVINNKVFGSTSNPWDINLTSGGSSGGSAAAVAAGMGSLALGSDGGGSVRIPSSFNGIFGMKASMGRVPLYPGCRDPRYPGASSWESFEHIGPMTRTVEDSALLLSVIAGPSPLDRYSIPDEGIDYLEAAKPKDLKGIRVAWSPDWGFAAVDPRVRKVASEAVKVFERLGCHIEEASPGFGDLQQQFWTLVARDTDLRALRKIAAERPDDLSGQLLGLLNTPWTAEDFTTAAMARQDMNNKLRKFMMKYDLLLTPTLCVPPFEHGINGPTTIEGREVNAAHFLSFTFPMNMTGLPAASVPAGWTEEGLPVGLQIAGRHLDDIMVLAAAASFEQANPWANRWPSLIEKGMGTVRR